MAIALSFVSFFYFLSFLILPNLSSEGVKATSGVESVPTLSVSPSSTLAFTVDPGTFNSASETVSVSTGNYTGYTLTLSTSGSSASLVHGQNSDYTIPSITGTKISSEFSNSWGYSLDGTNYKAIPNPEGDGDEIDSTSEANSEADIYTLTFGAHVNATTPAGTYANAITITASANDAAYDVDYRPNFDSSFVMNMPEINDNLLSGATVKLSTRTPLREGYSFVTWNTASDGAGDNYAPGDYYDIDPEIDNTIILYAIWECADGYICYYDNDADGGSMNGQEAEADSETVLTPSNFFKSDYGFAGWSTTPLNPDNVDFQANLATAVANDEVYGPNATITMVSSESLKLYAIWVPSTGILQGWNGCGSMSVGDVVGLTDSRDGQVYTVAKLIDEACYMVENLRLDFSDENTTITSLNTNHPTAEFVEEASTHPGPKDNYEGGRYRDIGLVYDNNALHLALFPNKVYSDGVSYNFFTMSGYTVGMRRRYDDDDVFKGDICPAGWRVDGGASAIMGLANSVNDGKNLYTYEPTSNPTVSELSIMVRSYPYNYFSQGRGHYYANSSYSNVQGYNFGGVIIDGVGLQSGVRSIFLTGYYTADADEEVFPVRCRVGSSTTYTLNYDANGGENAPASETVTNTTGIFDQISLDMPQRLGYTFVSWMDKDGIEVQPGGAYNAGLYTTNITLYATWSKDGCNDNATTIGTGNASDAVCLQDMNATVKSYMASANDNANAIQTYSLVDARDEKAYTVALLDDGNVWMTKNLALGEGRLIFLNSNDSDLSTNMNYTLPVSSLSSNVYTGENYDGDYSGTYYGGYYAWYTAVGHKNGYYNLENNSVESSICPSGWNLPLSEQYATLISEAGLTNYATASLAPYSFTYGGSKNNTGLNNQTTSGSYWTSIRGQESYAYAYAYNLTSSAFSLDVASSMSIGRSVRCVAKNGTATVHYDGNGTANYPTTGLMADQIVDVDSGMVLRNRFSRDRYSF